ncbi:unnamed protein product [Closterium sp. Naga37s-1]|nr:unnamed protein product [Closterium sp. Naga37s-1]
MASSLPESLAGSPLAFPVLSPLGVPPPPPFVREEGEDELSDYQEALLPRASQAAAATPAGITAEGGSGAAAGAAAAAAAGAKALPFCIAIAIVLFVVVILGVITFAARYYGRIHLRRARRGMNDVDSAATAGANGSQASGGGGLDAERIAKFPTWRYCICPAAAEDVFANKGDVCLSDFNEGELVRSVLPCEHRFHVACIDYWLATKTTCPVCRTDLKSLAPHAGEGDSDVAVKVERGDDAG